MASPPFILAFDLGASKLAAAVYSLDGERLCTLQRLPAMANQPQVLTLINIKRIGARRRERVPRKLRQTLTRLFVLLRKPIVARQGRIHQQQYLVADYQQ